jgi:hypothetical protein
MVTLIKMAWLGFWGGHVSPLLLAQVEATGRAPSACTTFVPCTTMPKTAYPEPSDETLLTRLMKNWDEAPSPPGLVLAIAT